MADEINAIEVSGVSYPLNDTTARQTASDAHTEAMAAWDAVYAKAPVIRMQLNNSFAISLYKDNQNGSGFFFNFKGAGGFTGWVWKTGGVEIIPRTYDTYRKTQVLTLFDFKLSAEYDSVKWNVSIGGTQMTDADIFCSVYFEVNGNNTVVSVEFGCLNTNGITATGSENVILELDKIFLASGDWVIPIEHGVPFFKYS